MQGYLLDTCVIIGLSQENSEAMELLINNEVSFNQCYFSVINRMEVLGFAKLTQQDEQILSALLSSMTALPLSESIETETILLRKTHKIKLPDAIVLATANTHCLELLTLDKHLSKKFS